MCWNVDEFFASERHRICLNSLLIYDATQQHMEVGDADSGEEKRFVFVGKSN